MDPVTGNQSTTLRTRLELEQVIRGLSSSQAMKVDFGFTDEMRNFMGLIGGYRFGEDLISYDIFRGRDAGLPTYNQARVRYNLTAAKTFADITSNVAYQGALEKLYGTVDRVEAYIGALAEDPATTFTELGPLLSASILAQFFRLRDGDRFFFENQGSFNPAEPTTNYFTTEEIQIVHQRKLRDLILDNFPEISNKSLPTNAFFLNARQLDSYSPRTLYPDPWPHPDGLPWAFRELSVVYHLYWALDSNFSITIQIMVQTDGWAGIGFNPDAFGSMKGADIVLCTTPDFLINDMPTECVDRVALDVGVPIAKDTLTGNRNHLTVYNISRVNGILHAMFSRPMRAKGPYDRTIGDNSRVIFAFNPWTNQLFYHGPTREPNNTVNFIKDYRGPPTQVEITSGVRIILYIMCAVGAVLSITYIIAIFSFPEYFKFQTPEFCYVVLFGSLLGYASVLLIVPSSQTNGTCKAHLWLFGMSFWIMFTGFFAKIARIWWIVRQAQKNFEATIVPLWKVCIPLAICMLGEAVFNIVWDTTVPPDLDMEVFNDTNTYTLYCGGNKYFWAGSVGVRGMFLVVGVYLGFKTRGMQVEVNWSSEIAAVIYTSCIVLIISIPLGFLLTGSATMVTVLKGLTISVTYIACTTIMIFDSLKRLILRRDPRGLTQATHSMKSNNSTAV
eukprot:TRINITY_DN5279_c0_g1_i8.p1 TRINITY_DN5279_c0_g1~~TRINITY_DN5279_c0_g1_i8.p1  ORF type:complete len:672 (+),score=129.71 TRINITY_DN5279_c0_g1_i8:1389-3404(+)